MQPAPRAPAPPSGLADAMIDVRCHNCAQHQDGIYVRVDRRWLCEECARDDDTITITPWCPLSMYDDLKRIWLGCDPGSGSIFDYTLSE